MSNPRGLCCVRLLSWDWEAERPINKNKNKNKNGHFSKSEQRQSSSSPKPLTTLILIPQILLQQSVNILYLFSSTPKSYDLCFCWFGFWSLLGNEPTVCDTCNCQLWSLHSVLGGQKWSLLPYYQLPGFGLFFFSFFLIEPILILVKFCSHTTELRNREKPTFIFIH